MLVAREKGNIHCVRVANQTFSERNKTSIYFF